LNSINSKSSKINLTYFDVGNSSSCFINTPGDYNVLINAGTSSKNYSNAENNIIPFLKLRSKEHIDLLIVTNLDKNEARNLIRLASNYKINKIVLPEAFKFLLDDDYLKEKMFSQNLCFINNALKLENTGELGIYICPVNKIKDNLIVKINYGEEKFIFTDFKNSDINGNNLFENNETAILKVPSSGSFNIITQELIAASNPKNVIISTRKENKKLNSDIFTSTLEKSGINVYKTFQNGALIFESDGEKTDIVNW